MSGSVFLNPPAILSALGEGISEHVAHFLEGRESPIVLSDAPFRRHGLDFPAQYLAEVKMPLRAFDRALPKAFHGRNNQLLWHCLAQIETQIEYLQAFFAPSRVAVVMGSSVTGGDENFPLFRAGFLHGDWQGDFNSLQNCFAAPAQFVAEQYGFCGLSYGVSTACTSGAYALLLGARLLKANLCDAVICGGVDALSPLSLCGFECLEVVASKRCNPFSAHRSGVNLGEGAAVFVLSREPLFEGALPLLGYGASSDAYHMSAPHPEGLGASLAIERALASAGLTPHAVGWLNLHGTGTLHNDKMESLAVERVFSGQKVWATSTKGHTGHTLGAAGALEAALTWAFCSRHFNPSGRLPSHLWDGVRDEDLPALCLTDSESVWQTERRVALSHSFAFGGSNVVLALGAL